MEYCEKSTLRDTIDQGLFRDTSRLWRLFREILDGLAYIHEKVSFITSHVRGLLFTSVVYACCMNVCAHIVGIRDKLPYECACGCPRSTQGRLNEKGPIGSYTWILGLQLVDSRMVEMPFPVSSLCLRVCRSGYKLPDCSHTPHHHRLTLSNCEPK